MNRIQPLETLTSASTDEIGGKAAALYRLLAKGIAIPTSLCIPTQAYHDFVQSAGLHEKILLELHRKVFSQMRWEEMWDTAQRIRLMFVRAPMPAAMRQAFADAIKDRFDDTAMLVVRSSAPMEDNRQHSFAGLHASYTHLSGLDEVVRHVRLVWASLWSDAALLYRQEIGLDTATSAMAVLIQEMVPGQASGILFTRDPTDANRSVIEAVHGMNPPLVDGQIEPDRWMLDATSGQILEHTPPEKRSRWQPGTAGTGHGQLSTLPAKLRDAPPLNPGNIDRLWQTGAQLAAIAQAPQDIEWTFQANRLVVLQVRPLTAGASASDGDQRAWYLSLHRSLDNLATLRQRIEDRWIPRMRQVADELSSRDCRHLSDVELADEIQRRWDVNRHWVDVYWEDFIPFAHGMRLFGQVYNEVMAPEDPYAFMHLLRNQSLISLERNRQLAQLADGLRAHPKRARALSSGDMDTLDKPFRQHLKAFIDRFGDLSCAVTGAVDCDPEAGTLAHILLEMAAMPATGAVPEKDASINQMEIAFLSACPERLAADSRQLLDLARASYRLRDDDNILLGAIEAQLIAAVHEAKQRDSSPQVAATLSRLGLDTAPWPSPRHQETRESSPLLDRQITGQPAGPGLARGRARIIRRHRDIARFKKGEIIVCDAVDPNMTFVMPLAAGIIERRGGMLIHGAIIAREYGLACVTGVVGATSRIRTGQTVTVDGYLGIVTIGATADSGIANDQDNPPS